MKTLFLSAGFAVLIGATGLVAQSATLAPTPTPTPTPQAAPTDKPAEAKADDKMACCDMCKADQDKPTPDTAARRAADEKTLRKLEQDWCDATANHDVDFITKVEVDDYTFTDSEGKITGKADEIREAKDGGDKIDFKLSDVKVRVYGNTAVLNGVTTYDKTDVDSPEVSFRWTDTFVRRANGEWQVAASQATSLPSSHATEKKDE